MEPFAVSAQEEKLIAGVGPAVLIQHVNVMRETLPLRLLAFRVEVPVCVVGSGYQAEIGGDLFSMLICSCEGCND